MKIIEIKEIYEATNGGLDVFCYFFSEIDPENPKKTLRLHPDDRMPTAGLFKAHGIWFLKDHSGTDQKAYTAIEFVRKKQDLSFADSVIWIAERFAPHLLSIKINTQ